MYQLKVSSREKLKKTDIIIHIESLRIIFLSFEISEYNSIKYSEDHSIKF